jgi:hypothetical protein
MSGKIDCWIVGGLFRKVRKNSTKSALFIQFVLKPNNSSKFLRNHKKTKSSRNYTTVSNLKPPTARHLSTFRLFSLFLDTLLVMLLDSKTSLVC